MIARDSYIEKPSSSIAGTRPNGWCTVM